ncbi:SusD/RagB family nutrient-binding outer membrane lipoprotein [uncultured Allomuricauda sp.]|uniref:SusD/RagB family nutrient-binding outer membrane lipoprotein n=1 Tax=Flagellimonas sp. W118 TaxID=3410791 RepID=UPI00260E572E|nr:SusD/RagB family nutrient-binding outer membrane lipoprotein [uncultured Allomuricauda sp.]
MKTTNRYILIPLAALGLFIGGCESTELDITQDPNALAPEQASVDFFLNSIQEDFVRQLEGNADFDVNDNWVSGGATNGDGFNLHGMELTRTGALYNGNSQNYQSVYQDSDFTDEWTNAYTGILQDINIMNGLAEEAGQTHHIAIAQFIEAYLIVSLVDFFGDIPYSEAFKGEEGILNPKLDSGAEVYQAALDLIDEAIVNFGTTASDEPSTDVFYANDYGMWIKAANTLKLKIYYQTRLVDANAISSFNAIIASGNYITDSSEDFQYSWPGTSASNPDTRHPRYGFNYTPTGASDFVSNWLMNEMQVSNDPRIRYYFYRQTAAVPGQEIPPNQETIRCSTQSPPQHYIDGGFTFCNLPNGYWGRDHGQNDGRDPDAFFVTMWGVYPFGGRFDDDTFQGIGPGQGGLGAGISPILTASWVDFMIAEVRLASNDLTAARAALLEGVNKSITKVQSFSSLDPSADFSFAPDQATVDSFVSSIGAAWDAATADGKWDVLGEQFFIACFGNGVEPYNFYRRTGYPTTVQANRSPNPGDFPRSMYYPSNAVNTNSNISQKPNQAQPVFWDNNPSGPIAN